MKISIRVLKVSFLISLLYLLSPFFVDYFWNEFTIVGWLAIGNYNNDYIDGFSRSIIYAFYFFPIIYLSISIFFTIIRTENLEARLKLQFKALKIDKIIFLFLILLYIIGFYFKLGITGVETPTEYKISGLLHYFRSYVILVFIVYYLMTSNASLTMIVIYSLVAGLTASSRFVGFMPLILFIIFSYLNPIINFNRYRITAFLSIIFIFIIITYSRTWVYSEYIDEVDIEHNIDVLLNILNQLFLRVGVGRDVILSTEVLKTGVCMEYFKFFWTGYSCNIPSLDFYGIDLEGSNFGLQAPTFASFYVLSGSIEIQIIIYLLFLLQIFSSGIIHINLARLNNLYYIFSIFSWLLSLIFIFVGPLLFFNYLLFFNILLLLVNLVYRSRFIKVIKI